MSIPEKVIMHANQIGIFERDRRIYLRAYERPTMKNIMKAKCIECCGFEDVRNRVWDCNVTVCPINPIRKRLFSYADRKTMGTATTSENE